MRLQNSQSAQFSGTGLQLTVTKESLSQGPINNSMLQSLLMLGESCRQKSPSTVEKLQCRPLVLLILHQVWEAMLKLLYVIMILRFNVVVTQMNGVDQPSQSIHALHVGKMRMKLCKGKTTIAKEYYSGVMQLCGVRGGGNAAAQAIFWQAKPGLSFIIAFESERDRNAAIMLARRFAFDCNIMLSGPGDRTP
ncbi:Stomatal closure-related actin-binding protein 1 [Bienertia sinuspersici]